jgi:hypothetical protein
MSGENYTFKEDTLYMQKERLTDIYPTGTFVLRINERREKYLEPIVERLFTTLVAICC